jgi:hypothetical protein
VGGGGDAPPLAGFFAGDLVVVRGCRWGEKRTPLRGGAPPPSLQGRRRLASVDSRVGEPVSVDDIKRLDPRVQAADAGCRDSGAPELVGRVGRSWVESWSFGPLGGLSANGDHIFARAQRFRARTRCGRAWRL